MNYHAEFALAPAPGKSRQNRGSDVVRAALLKAAIREFASRGFAGASGRRIATEAGAHQSQINYHFGSTNELWKAALLFLLDELDQAIAEKLAQLESNEQADQFAAMVRGFVHFAARRPELNRIMMHEGAAPSERLAWFVETQLAHRHRELLAAWTNLRNSGIAAEVDPDVLYHSMIGAASLLYANGPEAELLGIKPTDDALTERHAKSLIALLLPGRNKDS